MTTQESSYGQCDGWLEPSTIQSQHGSSYHVKLKTYNIVCQSNKTNFVVFVDTLPNTTLLYVFVADVIGSKSKFKLFGGPKMRRHKSSENVFIATSLSPSSSPSANVAPSTQIVTSSP